MGEKIEADRIDQILRNQLGIMGWMRTRCGDNFIGRLENDTLNKLSDETANILKPKEASDEQKES